MGTRRTTCAPPNALWLLTSSEGTCVGLRVCVCGGDGGVGLDRSVWRGWGGVGGGREVLIGVLFSGDQHLSPPHHPPATAHCFPVGPEGGVGGVGGGGVGRRDERAALANSQGSDI